MKTGKFSRIIALFFAVVVLSSCSGVKVHYDRQTDFSRYHRFAYVARSVQKGLPAGDARYILREIDRRLRALGLVPDESRPELLVKPQLDFHKRVDVYANPYGARKTGSREGNVMIVLTDAVTHKPVWRGEFYMRYANRRELRRVLKHKLDKLFAKYPRQVSQ